MTKTHKALLEVLLDGKVHETDDFYKLDLVRDPMRRVRDLPSFGYDYDCWPKNDGTQDHYYKLK